MRVCAKARLHSKPARSRRAACRCGCARRPGRAVPSRCPATARFDQATAPVLVNRRPARVPRALTEGSERPAHRPQYPAGRPSQESRPMTPSQIRDAVRTLQAQGQSRREISRLLKLSRNTVRRILRAPLAEGEKERQKLGVTRTYLQSAFARAQGNVVRVQQLLAAEYDLTISYST
ncbi:hypothetical protein C4901_02125 [Acidiferrobacter sp. SPIII_3]|nr:hypothetical protein C4901_02125 [Acidiferrobacter sp. SPIII_3]